MKGWCTNQQVDYQTILVPTAKAPLWNFGGRRSFFCIRFFLHGCILAWTSKFDLRNTQMLINFFTNYF